MGHNESFLVTAIRSLAESRQIKQQLRAVRKTNEANRGVIEYLPSQIEGFFDVNEPLGNVVLSGGDNGMRCRGVAAAAACAADKGWPVVLLHCGNVTLEQELQTMFGSSSMCVIVNQKTPVYEPLTGLDSTGISRLFLQAGTGMFAIPAGGKYYIEALAEFLRCRGIDPYCKMFFTCPHQQFLIALDKATTAGQLSRPSAERIKSLIMQGQDYRGAVETFFNRLEQQSTHMLCGLSRLNQRLSLASAVQQRLVLALDVAADTNDLLLNVVAGEIEELMSKSVPLCLGVDNISLSNNTKLARLLRSTGGSLCCIISSRDVYCMTGSDDAVFSDLVNLAQKVFISSHSGISCTKWSAAIGEYDKSEISESYSRSNHYRTFFSALPGRDNSANLSISKKREHIVKPEEINRFAPNEIVVLDRMRQEIAHAEVV